MSDEVEAKGLIIPITPIPGPHVQLCYSPEPLLVGMGRCGLRLGHDGRHTWETEALIKELHLAHQRLQEEHQHLTAECELARGAAAQWRDKLAARMIGMETLRADLLAAQQEMGRLAAESEGHALAARSVQENWCVVSELLKAVQQERDEAQKRGKSDAILIADVLSEHADDLTRAACDECEQCGPLVMCGFHSLLSLLARHVESTGAIDRSHKLKMAEAKLAALSAVCTEVVAWLTKTEAQFDDEDFALELTARAHQLTEALGDRKGRID